MFMNIIKFFCYFPLLPIDIDIVIKTMQGQVQSPPFKLQTPDCYCSEIQNKFFLILKNSKKHNLTKSQHVLKQTIKPNKLDKIVVTTIFG